MNTTDPVDTLQIQLYQVNAVQIDQTTSLTQLQTEITNLTAEIAALNAELTAKQAQLTSFTNYLTSIGVTDVTKPLTSTQIATITAAGYNAP